MKMKNVVDREDAMPPRLGVSSLALALAGAALAHAGVPPNMPSSPPQTEPIPAQPRVIGFLLPIGPTQGLLQTIFQHEVEAAGFSAWRPTCGLGTHFQDHGQDRLLATAFTLFADLAGADPDVIADAAVALDRGRNVIFLLPQGEGLPTRFARFEAQVARYEDHHDLVVVVQEFLRALAKALGRD